MTRIGGRIDKLPVFNIERFAIHDGEGIRTAVFLQGCGLRCPWCANPESWMVGPKLMYLEKKCVGCGACARVCPQGAASLQEGHAMIDREKCVRCGTCARSCSGGALQMSGKEMTCEEIFAVVRRDADYYRQTHGGLTLSGGEALLHTARRTSLWKSISFASIKRTRKGESLHMIGHFEKDAFGLPAFHYGGDLPYRGTLPNGGPVRLPEDPWFLLGNQQLTVFPHVSGEYELICGQRSWGRLNPDDARVNSGNNSASVRIQGGESERKYELAGMRSVCANSRITSRVFGCGYPLLLMVQIILLVTGYMKFH